MGHNTISDVLTRIHKSAPGPYSPFSFSEMNALGDDNDKDCSLLIEIFSSTKGGLVKSMDEVKSLAKTTVTVPQDFHSFAYQLKAFALATSFLFGDESILTKQLLEFMSNVTGKHCITYKNRIAADDTFAAKILLSVDSFVQIFLEDCRHRTDREDVDQRVIDFNALNMDVIMFRFHADLPRSFHKKEGGGKENKKPSSSSSSTGSTNENGKRKGAEKEKSKNKKLKNTDQVEEFKMAEGETWEKTFQGRVPDGRVKFNGTFMCARFHTKGECWEKGCKFQKSHVPVANIPEDKKQAYIEYMAECRKKAALE